MSKKTEKTKPQRRSRALSERLREQIAEAILNDKLADLEKDINMPFEQSMKKLGIEIYDAHYSKKAQAQMKRLPDGLLPMVSGVQANLGGQQYVFTFGTLRYKSQTNPIKKLCYYRDLAEKRTHREKDQMQVHITLEAAHPLSEKFNDLHMIRDEAHATRRDLKQNVWQILSVCNTTKQLETDWPEALPYVDAILNRIDSAAINLPVATIESVNEALGL